MIEKKQLEKLINVAAGRQNADLVLRNCRIVDVYSARLLCGDIAISGGFIAGIGSYKSDNEKDM